MPQTTILDGEGSVDLTGTALRGDVWRFPPCLEPLLRHPREDRSVLPRVRHVARSPVLSRNGFKLPSEKTKAYPSFVIPEGFILNFDPSSPAFSQGSILVEKAFQDLIADLVDMRQSVRSYVD